MRISDWSSDVCSSDLRATVTLTYLSTGFDWASNYVARVREDGKTLDLFAWLTVANSNGESFADAGLAAIAGTLNKVSDFEELAERPRTPPLHLRCFPTGSGRSEEHTSELQSLMRTS